METEVVAGGLNHASSNQTGRYFSIFALFVAPVLVFWPGLQAAISLAVTDDRYVQVLVAPLVTGLLVYWQRAEIFSRAEYSPGTGIPPFTLAMVLGVASVSGGVGGQSAGLLAAVSALVFSWLAAFVLCWGVRSFRAGLYPLCCLFLMIPPPHSWMDWIAACFQHGSAAVSYQILRLSGIPVLRHGLQFSLPGLDFEVAPECSGIRSGLALMMVAVAAAYVYLRSEWGRSALILLTIPLVLVKNAVRIAAISTLGAYVDRAFLDGPFHHRYGGLLFSAVGMVLFVLLLAGLQNIEGWTNPASSNSHPGQTP